MKKPKFIVAKIGKHGKGGNLPELHTTLFCDMSFVPSSNLQCENRTDRPQQTRDMTVVYYMTEGKDIIDEHVRKINQDKNRKIEEFMRPFTLDELASMPAKIRELKAKYRKYFNVLGI